MSKAKDKNKNEDLKTEEKPVEESKQSKEESKESQLYYFYTEGCAWCKRANPIVDELINEGHPILKLDLADGDNRKLQDEVKKTYNKQCGTPWFIDGSTGNDICGFREKDVILKWVNGEEIPAPPRPTGPLPKPPFHGASDKEINKWKKEYKEWSEKNSHMPNIQSAEQILERPRPKSDPPRPPAPGSTDEVIDQWGKDYEKWTQNNSHLPNLFPVDKMIERFKQRNQQMNNNPNLQNAPQPNAVNTNDINSKPVGTRTKLTFDQRLSSLENKIDKIIDALGA